MERRERPDAEFEFMILRICGILTIEEAAMMPIPRPLEMPSLMQAWSVMSMFSMREV